MKQVLVTGAAGFIGYHLCERLLKEGYTVIGLDNINDYYDVDLKYARLKNLGIEKDSIEYDKLVFSSKHGRQMQFVKLNLEDREGLPKLFEAFQFDIVCNLAAQAGVRYSLENPMAYIDSNVVGFVNILEACRHHDVKKFVYASSSSVYGNSTEVPFKEEQRVDHPISLYAATKKSNELMAYTYSHLYGIETIGLRFFTVYGPWGRPDMAMFLFTEAILNEKPINLFNYGDLSRDFTFIDDIINGILLILNDYQIQNNYQVLNIGNSQSVRLTHFIKEIENVIGKEAKKIMLPMQAGDVENTWADVKKLKNYGYSPNFSIKEGVRKYIEWFVTYYN